MNTLADKVCKRGHIGQYVERKGNRPACRSCLAEAVARFRAKSDHVPRSLKGLDKPLEELLTRKANLEIELTRLEIVIELKKQLGGEK